MFPFKNSFLSMDSGFQIIEVMETTVNRKETFPSKESDTKILQSIYFAYVVGIIGYYQNWIIDNHCEFTGGAKSCNRFVSSRSSLTMKITMLQIEKGMFAPFRKDREASIPAPDVLDCLRSFPCTDPYFSRDSRQPTWYSDHDKFQAYMLI